MLQFVAIAAGAAVAGVLGVAARRPDTFRMHRSAVIDAPPERIHPLISDFRKWADWSPYEKLDPEMKKTYSGAATGRGAVYAWEGNKKAGAGRMEMTETSPQRIAINLEFTRPFKASNVTTFTLQPHGAGTEVTWAMEGPNPFINKVMGVLINLDRLVGKDFEAGLANLKTIAERHPSAPAY
ncbi:SRPBCC family protein [Longimicrobium sp.]|uniref:SRPBCC family protein n=1 Tax=Longimicrobium sp. TaxID=2029185 RepID=UPI003B3B1768